jgi:RNA polymerase sigma-70 factor (ECF subfamily)
MNRMPVESEKLQIFNKHKPKLFGMAYRMLGTRDDAEDIVQEAYIRWHNSDPNSIETPEAWLVTVTTRLSIDRLRKAAHERETYIGPWLPEPLITSPGPSPEAEVEMASNLSLAFMTLLERLSATERAVFLLHDIFDLGYAEIAGVVGKTEASVRQIVHRARERVRSDKPRFEPNETERVQMMRKFAAASYAGDEKTLLSLFAVEVALTSDGGGKVNAARRTVFGAKRLTNLYVVAVARNRDHLTARLININGETGILEYADGEAFAVTTFTIENNKITAVYRVMNPDKLKAFVDLPENNFEDALSQTEGLGRLVN